MISVVQHSTELSDLAVWVGAGAVIVAAAIAGGVAVWRTKRSLAAEGDRLDAQLEHDRSLRDRAEVRELIDETLSAAQDGIYAAINMQSSILTVAHGYSEPANDQVFMTARGELRGAVRVVNRMQSRLSVRLPPEEGLPVAVHRIRAALDGVSYRASAAWPNSEKEDRDEVRDALKEAEQRLTEFEDEARVIAKALLTPMGTDA